MSIHMVMMENLLLPSDPELCMRDMKKYYNSKYRLNMKLINIKHITKLLEGKKGRVFGLGSVVQCYYGPTLRGSSGSDASSVPSSNVQPTPIGNMVQFVMQLIPTLTDHLLSVLVERVLESMSSPSHQPTTATNGPSDVVPVVDAPNVDEVRRASGSNDGHDHSTSQ